MTLYILYIKPSLNIGDQIHILPSFNFCGTTFHVLRLKFYVVLPSNLPLYGN